MVTIEEKSFKIANVKNVPLNCKQLVTPNDVIYIVPGDGLCAQNCVAALLFHDESFGLKLKEAAIDFTVQNWDKNYSQVFLCSPGQPFERKCNDGTKISFTKQEDLYHFLKAHVP